MGAKHCRWCKKKIDTPGFCSQVCEQKAKAVRVGTLANKRRRLAEQLNRVGTGQRSRVYLWYDGPKVIFVGTGVRKPDNPLAEALKCKAEIRGTFREEVLRSGIPRSLAKFLKDALVDLLQPIGNF